MTRVYSSKFLEVYYDEETKILKNKWLIDFIDDNKVIEEMENWAEEILQKKPKFLLTDNKVGHIVTVEIQEWMGKNFIPKMAGLGIPKYAIITSDELVSSISVEETVDEVKKGVSRTFQQRNFKTEEEAVKWLLA